MGHNFPEGFNYKLINQSSNYVLYEKTFDTKLAEIPNNSLPNNGIGNKDFFIDDEIQF